MKPINSETTNEAKELYLKSSSSYGLIATQSLP